MTRLSFADGSGDISELSEAIVAYPAITTRMADTSFQGDDRSFLVRLVRWLRRPPPHLRVARQALRLRWHSRILAQAKRPSESAAISAAEDYPAGRSSCEWGPATGEARRYPDYGPRLRPSMIVLSQSLPPESSRPGLPSLLQRLSSASHSSIVTDRGS